MYKWYEEKGSNFKWRRDAGTTVIFAWYQTLPR
jgi:hypothetical protein